MLFLYFLDCKWHDNAFMRTRLALPSLIWFTLGEKICHQACHQKRKKRKSLLFILRVHEMNPVISTHQGQIWCQSVWINGINAVNKCDTSATLSRCFSQHGQTLDRVCFTSRVTADVFAPSGVGGQTLPCCLRVCFDYESIGNVGLFWESGAQRSVMLLLWPSAHQSLKKASILHCKPLVHRVYIWLYSIKWSGCMFSNFLKTLFQPPIHKDSVFSLRFVCITK